jgi:hypothetical protein
MISVARTALLGTLLGALGTALPSCQQIAGIEDRTFDPGTPASATCSNYCSAVSANCTGTSLTYRTPEQCQGICAALEPGETQEPVGNNLACRADQATLAGSAASPDKPANCVAAGPGGPDVCGSNCESYCQLFAKICPAESALQSASPAECVAKCQGLLDRHAFDATLDYNGDSVQCRLVHTSVASVTPDPHCQHARILSTAPCADPPTSVPRCEDYCRLVTAECTGTASVYASLEQCLAVCAALPPGTIGDHAGNNIGCRKSFAYSAVIDPVADCPHAGPSGDGVCGVDAPGGGSTGNCDSYCTLLEAACRAAFAVAFTDQAACQSECAGRPGAPLGSGYSVATATGNTVQCRILHASAALTSPSECTAALGGPPCR